jgi:hypothetical protein
MSLEAKVDALSAKLDALIALVGSGGAIGGGASAAGGAVRCQFPAELGYSRSDNPFPDVFRNVFCYLCFVFSLSGYRGRWFVPSQHPGVR